MPSIADAIHKELVEHKNGTGREPRRVYLGLRQWMTLKQWARSCGYTVPPDYDDDIPEYFGVRFYRVHIDDHFHVA